MNFWPGLRKWIFKPSYRGWFFEIRCSAKMNFWCVMLGMNLQSFFRTQFWTCVTRPNTYEAYVSFWRISFINEIQKIFYGMDYRQMCLPAKYFWWLCASEVKLNENKIILARTADTVPPYLVGKLLYHFSLSINVNISDIQITVAFVWCCNQNSNNYFMQIRIQTITFTLFTKVFVETFLYVFLGAQ